MSTLEQQAELVGRYHRYGQYVSSGYGYLPEVPEHWVILRNRQLFRFKKRPVGKWANQHQLLSLTLKGIIPRDIESGKGKMPAEFDTYQVVEPNNIVFCLFDIDETPRTVGLSSLKGMVTGAYAVAEVAKEHCPEFVYYYYLHLDEFKGLRPFYTGLRKVVRPETFMGLRVPTPPQEEQRTIAAFLDYETARIDRLITQQQRLIELLKEKRQAVISHAVTKGLNPNAPMKDSGVEWLGQVPEHWGVSPLKYKCEFSGGGTPSKDNLEYWNGSIPWVSPKDMKSFWITDAEDKITEQAIKESSTKLVQPGAVLMVVRSGILQRTIPVGINTIPVTMNQDMKAIRFSSAVYAEWLSFFIKGYEDSLLLDWRKQGATVESIEHEYLANSLILFPPEEEARSIIAALGRRLDKFDQLEQRASDAITLLQERRSALISAAVTGKIDLRGWTQPAEEVAA
ncbi:TPA: restriction endonuclease subunit S [Aeromonas salmonicida]|nr:restriction endonuclease subunit S [Aeromonas salmonicida]HEH9423336.1 restriction endonuclease subunit S [Aeromonas salmonicida]HEH9436531.1 restriction endonuclease subunit S [Aeromonas salmonicida]